MANWIDTVYQWAGVQEPANPIELGFHVLSPLEPGGIHEGVDLPVTGTFYSPVAGTYDPAASGKYRVAIDVPGGEVIFAHIYNALFGDGPIHVGSHQDLGNVLMYNPQSGKPFSQDEGYTDPAGGWYVETNPHVHVEAHPKQGDTFGNADAVDPVSFVQKYFTGSTDPTSGNGTSGGGSGNNNTSGGNSTSNNNNGDIKFNVGPVPVDIPNPLSGFGTQITGTVSKVENDVGQLVRKMALTGGLALAGFIFFVLAFRKEAVGAVATAAKVA